MKKHLHCALIGLSAMTLLMGCVGLRSGTSATKAGLSPSSVIAVTIPFDSHDTQSPFGFRHHDEFHVLLTNVSSNPVRVWQEWCSWGYYCLQIEIVEKDGIRHLLKKKRTNFLMNFPDYVELQPGTSVVWNVNLDPSLWEDLSWFPRDEGLDAKVRAIFTAEKPEDDEDNRVMGVNHMGVWTGKSMSGFYDFTLFGPATNQNK